MRKICEQSQFEKKKNTTVLANMRDVIQTRISIIHPSIVVTSFCSSVLLSSCSYVCVCVCLSLRLPIQIFKFLDSVRFSTYPSTWFGLCERKICPTSRLPSWQINAYRVIKGNNEIHIRYSYKLTSEWKSEPQKEKIFNKFIKMSKK